MKSNIVIAITIAIIVAVLIGIAIIAHTSAKEQEAQEARISAFIETRYSCEVSAFRLHWSDSYATVIWENSTGKYITFMLETGEEATLELR